MQLSLHIPIKYHFLREQVIEQKVKLEYVPSKEQVADILTKPLPRETFGKGQFELIEYLTSARSEIFVIEVMVQIWIWMKVEP